MPKKINVLIFPAGEINSIELHDALSSCVNINVYGASSVERHGSYVFKNYIPDMPMIAAENFLEQFNRVLSEYKIDVIFPTHDTVAVFLSEHRDQINAKLIVADKKTTEICRDKVKTYQALAEYDFIPKTYDRITEFPVFIKPIEGQGAQGIKLIKTQADIPADIDWSKYVICEYLPGEEYTVDCLTDKNGQLVAVSPRSRDRVMAGVSVAARSQPLTDDIRVIAEQINQTLNFMGLWFFQIKRDINNQWKLLEVSTRCAGTMCLTRARGMNLPLLSVYTAMGYDVTVQPNDYNVTMDRTLISRYKIDYAYDTVYLDFDDTLIMNDAVHLPTIWFVYQCRNQGKKIHLITKHEFDLVQTLSKYALSEALFDSIIHLKPNDIKSRHIDPLRAIFVDNAHKERVDVQQTHHIPVFDVDGIEVLMDWRC